MKTSIGKQIRNRRLELNLSQDELAKRTGYSDRTAISKIESGLRDIPQSKISLFADALSTTPAYLLGFTEPSAGLTTQQTRIIIDRFENATEEVQKAICLLLGIDYANLQR